MGLMDAMMDMMLKSISKKKREKMMIEMMPLMMEGIDLYEFMPGMMEEMLKDVTVDDVIALLKRCMEENEKLKDIAGKIAEANLIQQMMFKTYPSKLGFDDTVETVEKAAKENGWLIPDIRDLQEYYMEADIKDMTRLKVIYFCNPAGGYKIVKDDPNKSMSVMMPLGVSVYETTTGKTEVATMNLGMMSGMFSGATREVLSQDAENLEKTMRSISAEEQE